MAIVTADIQYRLSGGAGNTNPNASLGGVISATAVNLATPLNNLFDDITGDENAASDVEYRCVYVRNNHATLTWQNVVAWLSADVAGGAALAIGLDNAGNGDGSATGVAATVATEGTAPGTGTPGVTAFSAPTTKAAGLAIGNLAPGQARAIWFRRSAANTAAINNDGGTLRCEGDTAA